MPVFGQRPNDVVQDTRGNTLRGVRVTLYPSHADATAETNALGFADTDVSGRWAFATDATAVWARVPGGTVWQVSNDEVAATVTQLDAETSARAAGDAALDVRVSSLEAAPGGGGVTDHGALTGLADDDHPQYHTDARGDARYYTQAQVDAGLSGKAASSHSHAVSDVTGLQADLDGKAATSHTHVAADVTDSTTVGRGVLTAASQAAARTAIDAAPSSTYGVAVANRGDHLSNTAGRWHGPAGATGTWNALNNMVAFFPVQFPRAITITDIGVNITRAGDASSVMRFGLFTRSVGAEAFTLHTDLGQVTATATGIVSITGLSVAVDPDGTQWYWGVGITGASGNGTIPQIKSAAYASNAPQFYGSALNSAGGDNVQGWRNYYGGGAFASSITPNAYAYFGYPVISFKFS